MNLLRSLAGLALGAVLLGTTLLVGAGSAGRPVEGWRPALNVASGRLSGPSPGQTIIWNDGCVVLRNKGSTTELFRTPHHVLKVVWSQSPALPPQLLVLTAEDVSGPQPRRSALYSVDPTQSRPPRRLSPEAGYNFWDISMGDVDGDGSQEIGLCTYSQTARDPRFARRFFVYGWDGDGDLYPRWRGSRLCRPYVCAQLADIAGDEKAELLSVEVAPNGKQIVVAYEWNQFGFWGLGHSLEYDRVLEIAPRGERGEGVKGVDALVAGLSGGDRRVSLELDDSRLQPVARDPGERVAHHTKRGG